MVISCQTLARFAHGRQVRRITGVPGVNRSRKVVASITELDAATLDTPFIGAASMSVLNIAPQDDGTIHILIFIDWPNDLHYRFSGFVDP